MDYLYWTLTLLLLLTGLVGSVVPLLPGTTLMFAAVVLQRLLLPATLTWTAVAWIGAIWLLSLAIDLVCTLIGTRLFGGSKWGMTGATGGALVGMFFSLPALLLGTMFGAVAAEKLLGRRTDRDALRSGVGATVGFLAGTVARAFCALLMLALFAYAVFTAMPSR